MKNIYTFGYVSALLATVIVSNPANAGLSGLTHFSRANCFNNESISWDGMSRLTGAVNSRHIKFSSPGNIVVYHVLSLSMRQVEPDGFSGVKAMHIGEGNWGWEVFGTHSWFINGNPNLFRQTKTSAHNCNLSQF